MREGAEVREGRFDADCEHGLFYHAFVPYQVNERGEKRANPLIGSQFHPDTTIRLVSKHSRQKTAMLVSAAGSIWR
jgi:hypothetical protein